MIQQLLVQGLRTLALGHLIMEDLEIIDEDELPVDISLSGQPLPSAMSRLTALSSLALHHIGWEYAPHGLPSLPQVCFAGFSYRQCHPLSESHADIALPKTKPHHVTPDV